VWEKWEARGPRTPPRLGSRAWQNEGGGAAPMGLALASGSACPILLPAGWHGSARVLPSNSPFARGGGLRSGVCTSGFARWGWHGAICMGGGKGLNACRAVPGASSRGGGEGDRISCPAPQGAHTWEGSLAVTSHLRDGGSRAPATRLSTLLPRRDGRGWRVEWGQGLGWGQGQDSRGLAAAECRGCLCPLCVPPPRPPAATPLGFALSVALSPSRAPCPCCPGACGAGTTSLGSPSPSHQLGGARLCLP